MTREPNDAKGARGSSTSVDADTPPAGAPALVRSRLLTEIEPPTDIGFSKEADTLQTHGALKTLPRRDTTPAPPDDTASVDALDDDDILDDDEDAFGYVPEDDTQVERRFASGDDITSPTLSLASQSDAAREVYRMFLASEYAPALELADELIAQGMNDPMLVTIARECRSSMAAIASSAPPPPPRRLLNDGAPHTGVSSLGMFDGTTTIEEVATMTGTSVEQVVALLERFVTVLPARPRR
ncbi:MAG: hypothetical protein K0S65_3271 [Labilithrix sp.]|nr:hypothetical protein [Labilithrix sp.]